MPRRETRPMQITLESPGQPDVIRLIDDLDAYLVFMQKDAVGGQGLPSSRSSRLSS